MQIYNKRHVSYHLLIRCKDLRAEMRKRRSGHDSARTSSAIYVFNHDLALGIKKLRPMERAFGKFSRDLRGGCCNLFLALFIFWYDVYFVELYTTSPNFVEHKFEHLLYCLVHLVWCRPGPHVQTQVASWRSWPITYSVYSWLVIFIWCQINWIENWIENTSKWPIEA